MLAELADSKRRWTIALVAMGLVFLPLLLFSVAAVTLSTLRRGWKDGLFVLLIGWGAVQVIHIVLVQMASETVRQEWLLNSLYGLALLACALLMAWVLRKTSKLNLAILAGVLTALAMLMGAALVFGDSAQWWQTVLGPMVEAWEESLRQQGVPPDPGLQFQYGLVTGWLVASLFLLAMFGLFLGRSWQARLVNPGGFQQEFHSWRLGMPALYATAVIYGVVALWQTNFGLWVAILVNLVWVVQGIAVIHWLVRRHKLNRAWLVAFYVTLVVGLASPLIVLIGVLGLLANIPFFAGLLSPRGDSNTEAK